MCGIVGVYNSDQNTTTNKDLSSMISSVSYRGPDDKGFYNDDDISLAHVRLSVLDLSSRGHQPMEFENLVIVLNGEIYNFLEVRKTLQKQGYKFNSNSDTEVLLKAYHYWGKESIDQLRGMFSFAIWDKVKKELIIVRDRAGVKPLYYYASGELLIFASELRAIIKHPKARQEIDFSSLGEFLQFGYISAPRSIYKNIYKLEPGSYLRINQKGQRKKTPYWNLTSAENNKLNISEDQALERMEELLSTSFNYRMVSDVPAGVFLSGGVDSSLVTALLQKSRENSISTFTMGFREKKWDESRYAKKIADYLGTQHHEFFCSQKDALDIVPQVAEIYDEPFADSSFIPTYLLFSKLNKNMKVVLSADGGDELFAGYNRYFRTRRLFNLVNLVPRPLTASALYFLSGVNKIKPFYNFEHRRDKILAFYKFRKDLMRFYQTLTSYWFTDEVDSLLGEEMEMFKKGAEKSEFSLSSLQLKDFKKYLPDDILVKVDRASMHNSIEARAPFLGKEVIEFAFRLPDKFKMRRGKNKYILRRLLNKHVPRKLTDRPKRGFGVPLDKWLRDDLKQLLEEYLNKNRIENEGIFNWEMVKQEKEKFQQREICGNRIWNLLVFEIWKERWM